LTDEGGFFETPREEIDEALSCASKFRILAALGKDVDSPVSLYALCRQTRLANRVLRKRLSNLISCEWVKAIGEVGAKRYSLNLTNPRTRLFLDFLRMAEYYSET
jgi:hypothetical protein